MINLIRDKFSQVPNELINDRNLHPVSRFIFVYLCSKPSEWKFFNSDLCRACGLSEETLAKYMKQLSEAGWITKSQKKDDKGAWAGNDIVLHPYPEKPATGILPFPGKPVPEKTGNRKSPEHSNTDISNNTELFSNTDILSIPAEVLNYLNLKKNTKGAGFKDTPSNTKEIKARLKEKFTKADFEAVIDLKVSQWGSDPKMKQYLRPETLFGSKFNGYLEETLATPGEVHDTSNDNFVNEECSFNMLKQ